MENSNETENLSHDELKNDDELTSDEKLLINWYETNKCSLYLELALVYMLQLDIISKETYTQIQAEVVKKADILKELSKEV